MKSCKNCIHRSPDLFKEPCKSCYGRNQWEHDGKPSACDGCAFFGKNDAEHRQCYHCIDGSNKISPELLEARKRYKRNKRARQKGEPHEQD